MKMLVLALLLISQVCTAAAAATCAGGIYASIASLVSGYGPAYTYCSSKYPLPVVTSTVTAPTSTRTITVTTVTVTSTVATATTTTTGPASTLTTTVNTVTVPLTVGTTTVVLTTTTTTTVTSNLKRSLLSPRNPKPAPTTTTKTTTKPPSTTLKTSTTTPPNKSSCWSSVTVSNPAWVGSVCTCLETAVTTTTTTTPSTTRSVTATSTSSVTATSTVTVTPIVTMPVTATATLSLTDTTTTTTTVTITSTVAASPTCQGAPDPYVASNGVVYGLDCGKIYEAPDSSMIIAQGNQPSFTACLDFCAQYSNIRYVDYFGQSFCVCLNSFGGGGLLNSPSDAAAHVIL